MTATVSVYEALENLPNVTPSPAKLELARELTGSRGGWLLRLATSLRRTELPSRG